MGDWYQWQGKLLLLSVRVQPRASKDEIVGPHGTESLKVRITAPPVDGKANAHLVKFLAKSFGVAKSQVELVSGTTGRDKRLAINGPKRLPEAAQIAPAATGKS
ncbi:MAG TPA: DUF167 family protein [Gammaproteobacteria bacterium]